MAISTSSRLSGDKSTRDLRKAAGVDQAVIDTILKEAVAGDLNDAKMIASTVANRSKLTGRSWKSIISAKGQYTAYTRKGYPPGVNQPKYRAIVEQAIDDVLTNGPVTAATFYATPGAVHRLPGGLEEVGQTAGHIYKVDPQNRPIATSRGYVAVRKDRAQEMAESIVDTIGDVAADVRGAFTGGQKGHASRPKSRGLQDVADVTDLPVGGTLSGAWSETPSANMKGVDRRLPDILSKAAEQFAQEFPGHHVEAFSGAKGRATGTPNHPRGKATDVNIYDAEGNKLANVRNGDTFPTYERYARIARDIQQRDYPELDDRFTWGGYFQQGTAFDQMHFDIGGVRGAFGNWDEGLNDAGRRAMARLGYPDVQSIPAPEQTAKDLIPPGMEVEQATLAPVETVQALPSAETIQPSAFAPEISADSFASLLSPVSTAEAAPQIGAESAPQIGPGEQISALASEQMAPLSDYDTIVGQDVTPPSQQPEKGWRQPVAEQQRPLDAFQPASVQRAMELASMPQMGDMFAENVQPDPTAAALSPMGTATPATPINSAVPATPVNTAQPLSAIPGPVVGSIEDSYIQQPLASEVVSPLTSEVMQPLSDYETLIGQDVTLPDPNEDLIGTPAPVVKRAPALNPPKTIQPRPIAVPQVAVPQPPMPAGPPTPQPRPEPSLSVADILGGALGQATATDGNVVSRDAYGRTAVTNKFGATTVTLPDGRQAASNQKGPLTKKSLSDPFDDIMKDIEKGLPKGDELGGTLLGGLIGLLAGGPLGAAGGAKLGNRIAKPGGLLNSPLGRLFAGEFPDAPRTPPGYTDRSADFDRMRSISPDVAGVIDQGDITGIY